MAARTGGQLPRVMGHEGSGVVEAVGSGVTSLKPGDPVAPLSIHFCRACRFCNEGRTTICDRRPTLGIEVDGVLGEYIVVPADRATRLPDGLSLEAGALSDPVAVALQAFERVPIGEDDVVAIVGAGTIGLILALTARAYRPKRLFLIGLEADRERLRLAESLGVDAVTAPDAAAARRVLDGVTGGYGADVAFETAGHPVAVQTAIHLARKGGRVGVVGLPHDPTPIDTAQLVWSEKTLVAVRGYNERCWVRGQELMADGSIDLLPLVTHRLPLARSEEAFDLVRRRAALKVIVQP
jgi:L-iditol 2-dehydrogenase